MQRIIHVLPEKLAVCRLNSPALLSLAVLDSRGFWALVQAEDELSLVCAEKLAPSQAQIEPGWRALRVQGPLDFSLVGVLAELSAALAQAGISLFAISTYDTDYILVKEHDLASARSALQQAGWDVLQTGAEGAV